MLLQDSLGGHQVLRGSPRSSPRMVLASSAWTGDVALSPRHGPRSCARAGAESLVKGSENGNVNPYGPRLSREEEGNPATWDNMDGPWRIRPSERSQTKRTRAA